MRSAILGLTLLLLASHAAGDARYVAALSRAALAVGADGLLTQYVNDRPYVASSFLSVAIARVCPPFLVARPANESSPAISLHGPLNTRAR